MRRNPISRIVHPEQLQRIYFTLKEVAKILWRINPRFTVLIFVMSALWGAFTFPTFYLEKLILDRIVANIGNPVWQPVLYSIAWLVLARVTVELLRNLLNGLMFYFRQYASKNFHIEIELMLAEKLTSLDIMSLEDPTFQDRYNKIEREAGRRAWGIIMSFTDIPNFVTGFASSVAILWFLHPLVAAGVVLVSLPSVFIDRKFVKKWYDFELVIAPHHRIRGHIAHYLIRTKNFLESRILGLRGYLIEKMRKVHYEIARQELDIQKQQQKAQIWLYLPSSAFYAAINLYLIVQTLTAKITVGSYELFLRSLLSASQNFSSLTNSLLEIYENYVFVSDLVWFMNLESKINSEGGQVLNKIKKSIEMEDVWFRYREDGNWILKGVDLMIGQGEKIAIVGENGAGKSTLIKVLTRFYDPTKGKVLVDGVNVKSINYPQYQSKFAVLFQDFEDYSFSARESIGYGDIERIDKLDEIKEAARKTGIHEYIEELPLGYDNPLNPHFTKGVQLSGGQWQRIGIARVLFRKRAQIIILDEPTSNVDPEAEEKIFNELMKTSRDKTLIFVSQRFSTVRRADRIIVIDRGKIIEQGSHEELMKKKGKYARLFSLQAKGYK